MQRFGVGLIVWLAACATGSASPGVGAGELVLPGRDSVEIEVSNRNFYDANISYRFFGTVHRLGTVTGNTTKTFAVRYEPAPLVIVIQLIGPNVRLTDEITVSPGDRIQVTVPPDAHRQFDSPISLDGSSHPSSRFRQ
jgi:hypothetical protein